MDGPIWWWIGHVCIACETILEMLHTAKQWVENFYEVSLNFLFSYGFVTDNKITFINDVTNFSSIFDSSP